MDPPDFASATFGFYEKLNALPRALLARGCRMSVYIPRGACRSLADFDFGWEGNYVEVYEHCLVTEDNPGDRFVMDSDDPVMSERTVIVPSIYNIGGIQFAEKNASGITLEVLDVCYGNYVNCGDCGPASDGTRYIYAVEKGAAGAAPIVHYSADGGLTWSTSSITAAANAETPCKIAVMGSYLVVLSPTANTATNGGYYYALINPLTGAPGSWTKVTAGFTNNREPRDMWVANDRLAFICTDSGEILRIRDVVAGAESLGVVTASDLARISGSAAHDTIVAVGASATVVRSWNMGQTFAATTTSPGAAALTAVEVLDKYRWWVGNASGVVYYTLNAGESAWTTRAIDGSVPTAIQDIRFPTNAAGIITYQASGPLARVAYTINGGVTFVPGVGTVNPRLSGLPTSGLQKFNRIAYPRVVEPNIAVNYAIFAGLGATTDGTLMLGAPNVF
jgi:hypothetical protein